MTRHQQINYALPGGCVRVHWLRGRHSFKIVPVSVTLYSKRSYSFCFGFASRGGAAEALGGWRARRPRFRRAHWRRNSSGKTCVALITFKRWSSMLSHQDVDLSAFARNALNENEFAFVLKYVTLLRLMPLSAAIWTRPRCSFFLSARRTSSMCTAVHYTSAPPPSFAPGVNDRMCISYLR